ncbi:MAG: 16S rRNA (uracil(1498)-N(3))-methyltransferase [Firmicutes bacterium]|nr:16S rRNA (uracil(1498)-N(3))-methyltransferase [Bacillota bacterium]
MRRFFVSPEQVGANLITIEDKNDLHHMKKVLRLAPGDEVDISDGSAWEYRARIEYLEADMAQLQILDKQSFATEPATRVTLYQGIPKQGKMETIIQKCVELGVHRVVPVFMDRTVVVDKGNFQKKIDRWQKVSAEAVKQCRRGIIPEVSGAMRMKEVLAELAGDAGSGAETGQGSSAGAYDLVLIPYENEDGTTIKDVLRCSGAPGAPDAVPVPRSIAVLIGPEGGFSEEEVAKVIEAGGRSVSLGKTTLRTETAGMASLAMIMYELEL